MIQLGMTDCPAVRSLFEQGSLELDYLEVHGPYVAEARALYAERPMLLHNALYQWSLVHANGLAHKDCARLTLERLALARSPWYSVHLGFCAEEVEFGPGWMLGTSPELPAWLVFERTCERISQLMDLVKVPFLVENLDYNPSGAYETICEPQFIAKVLEKTGAYWLLDLAHARISAAALGMPVETYLEQLPLERVRQVHVNHALWDGQRLWDAHEALQAEDEALIEWTLARCQPWSVTLEYNKDADQILLQVARLRQLLQGR